MTAIATEKDKVRQFKEHVWPIGVWLALPRAHAVRCLSKYEDRALVVMDWVLATVR